MVDKENLSKIFVEIRQDLDNCDSIREQLLPIQRQAIRNCSEIIKLVHRHDLSFVNSKITETKDLLQKMRVLNNKAEGNLGKDYLLPVQQELGEAVILNSILNENKFPLPKECGIDTIEYAYALCDVIGELRRYCLTCIREEKLSEAIRSFEYMEEIHSQLFTLDYPSGLVPGLRNKIDQARQIIAKTEGDVTLATSVIKLNANLKSNKN